MQKVILAYSGGLDTSVIIQWLKENMGLEVICFAANVGQGKDIRSLRGRAIKSGAKKIYVEDLKEEEVPEQVDQPGHYNQGKIPVIDFIEDQEHLGFGRLTALKYICRSGKKYSTSKRQDLEKAIWYLKREIAKDEM